MTLIDNIPSSVFNRLVSGKLHISCKCTSYTSDSPIDVKCRADSVCYLTDGTPQVTVWIYVDCCCEFSRVISIRGNGDVMLRTYLMGFMDELCKFKMSTDKLRIQDDSAGRAVSIISTSDILR